MKYILLIITVEINEIHVKIIASPINCCLSLFIPRKPGLYLCIIAAELNKPMWLEMVMIFSDDIF
jgi:hypothetical protein